MGDSPAAYWRLGESAGTVAYDQTSNHNDGTYICAGSYGCPVLGQPGAIAGDTDTAVSLNGSGDNIGIARSSSLSITGALSLEAWVTNAGPYILGSTGDGCGGTGYELGWNYNWYFRDCAGGTSHVLTGPGSVNGWTHVIATRTAAGVVTIYVNGAQVATGQDGGGALVAAPGVGLGNYAPNGGGYNWRPYNGTIDEVAIYPAALSPTQVLNHWQAGNHLVGAPTNVTASLTGANQATVSWTDPSWLGSPAATSYIVTPSGTNPVASVTVPASATTATVVGLASGDNYTFTVTGVNSYGNGFASSASNSIATGSAGQSSKGPGLGQFLYYRTMGNLPFPAGSAGVVSQNNLPVLSTWTVEGDLGYFASYATTESEGRFGILSGSPSSPGGVSAGIVFDSGGGIYFVYPGGGRVGGGSFTNYCPSGASCHFAETYDGSTVRGFANGALIFANSTTGAGTSAAPAGYVDYAASRQATLDELRVSSVARYTAAYNPPQYAFNTDSSTSLLWHLDDYQIGQLASNTVNGSGGITLTPNFFSDSSGNGNNAQLYINNSGHTCCWENFTFFSASQSVGPNGELGGINLEGCGCRIQDSTANPVNTATGEFWHTFTDLAVPGRGLALNFSRTYSSLAAANNGRLGYGWKDTYASSLSIDQNGNATLTDETGAVTKYTLNGSSFSAQPRIVSTLVKNGDGSYTLTRKDKSQLQFSAAGKLTGESDRNGYLTTLAYDGSGRLQTVTDPAGRTLTLTYDPTLTSNIHSISDTASPVRSVSYAYDASGNLSSVTDPAGQAYSFTYDSGHRLLTMKDPVCSATPGCNGLVNVYDGNGRVSQQTDPAGSVTKFSYAISALGVTTTTTDPRGNQTVEEYVNGILMSTTRGSGTPRQATWTYMRDWKSLAPTGVTDPNGHSISQTVDSAGNLLTTTDALNRTTTYTYNAFNEPLTALDASGVTTTNTYDANGNLTQTRRPLTGTSPLQYRTISYTYGDANRPGDVTQMTDADGKVWTYTYDQYGDRTSQTDPLGNRTTYAFDGVGRMTSSVSPKGNVSGGNPSQFTTSYTYNAFDQVLTVTDPLSHVTTSAYDADHNLTSLTDPNNNQTTYVYDLDNQQTEVHRPGGSVLKTFYDGSGNVTQQIDGLSHATAYSYDPLNRKASTTDALNRVTTYGYDGAGNLTSLVDATNQTTTYGYDAADELTSITYSDGTTHGATFTYDPLGRRATMADGTGTTTYSYDSLGRLTQSQNGAGGSLGYGYDLKGQLTSIVYPGTTGTVIRTYDDAGRLKTVQDWLSHVNTISYDANSNLTGIAYANGVQAASSFDNADRMTGVTDTSTQGLVVLLTLNYTRSNGGQLTGENANQYGYDGINRLTSSLATVAGPPPVVANSAYTYDNADRLTQIAISGGNTSTLAYDNADQLGSLTVMNGATQVQKYTYGFDAKGNRTSVTDQSNITTNLGFDQANRLISYGTGATYAYDGDGLGQSKTVSGATTAFTWDLAEGLPLIVQAGSTNYVTGPGGLPLEQISGSNVYYYQQDQLGSTRLLTDSTGAVADSLTYDAYGNVTASSGSVANPFTFSGQYADAESGLIYLRARYYDPVSAQFTSVDPAGSTTRHRYVYVVGSPTNGIDPSGLINWGAGLRALVDGSEHPISLHDLATTERNLPGIMQAFDIPVFQALDEWTSGRTPGSASDLTDPNTMAQVAMMTSGRPGRVTQMDGGSASVDTILSNALKWLGCKYNEIHPGVFRSTETEGRQFRMKDGDLTDPVGAHVHFESVSPNGDIENSHVYIEP